MATIVASAGNPVAVLANPADLPGSSRAAGTPIRQRRMVPPGAANRASSGGRSTGTAPVFVTRPLISSSRSPDGSTLVRAVNASLSGSAGAESAASRPPTSGNSTGSTRCSQTPAAAIASAPPIATAASVRSSDDRGGASGAISESNRGSLSECKSGPVPGSGSGGIRAMNSGVGIAGSDNNSGSGASTTQRWSQAAQRIRVFGAKLVAANS